MRVWHKDIPLSALCRSHLLGLHREIHCLMTYALKDSGGYQKHPETLRWKGHTLALSDHHGRVADEMSRRGYNHQSPCEGQGSGAWPDEIDSLDTQLARIRAKGCECRTD